MKRAILLVLTFLLLTFSGTALGAVTTDDLVSLISEPDGVLTRGEYFTMLVTAADMEGDTAAADLLVEKGIIKGYPDGKLHLDRAITKVEAVSVAARAMGLNDSIAPPGQIEISLAKDHWAYNLYAWFIRQGLVGENPEESLSERQGAAFLQNVFTSDPEAITILENSQANARERNQTLRVVMSGSSKVIPRTGVAEAEKIPQMATNMRIVQEMVLPDKIHQKAIMNIQVPNGKQNLTTESYMINGEMYLQMPDADTGDMKWYRYPPNMLPDLEQMIKDVEQQSEVVPPELEEFLHFQLLGTTEINGEKVYKIAFYGRVDDFNKFMEAAMGQLGDAQQFQQLQQSINKATAMLDSMSYWGIEYLGVDDYLPRSAEYTALIVYAKEFEGKPVPLKAMQTSMQIEEYRYGEDIAIELPAEAQDAPVWEIPVKVSAEVDRTPSIN